MFSVESYSNGYMKFGPAIIETLILILAWCFIQGYYYEAFTILLVILAITSIIHGFTYDM
ncbi:hypothetical protein V1511DRAFT_496166 [Dipodascopsis uninucleata]